LAGDRKAAADLLPRVYDELRQPRLQGWRPSPPTRLAAHRPSSTRRTSAWWGRRRRPLDNRGHFFAAAAEAMRRILVDAARRKSREKHGGDGPASTWNCTARPRQTRATT